MSERQVSRDIPNTYMPTLAEDYCLFTRNLQDTHKHIRVKTKLVYPDQLIFYHGNHGTLYFYGRTAGTVRDTLASTARHT